MLDVILLMLFGVKILVLEIEINDKEIISLINSIIFYNNIFFLNVIDILIIIYMLMVNI